MAKRNIVVIGVEAIDKKLRKLSGAVGKKVVRRSMRKGMKIIAAATKSEVPVDTGLTKKSVQVRALKRSRKRLGIEVRVSGKVPGLIKTSAAGKRTFYPAVVEYGRKGVPGNPFMRRAYSANAEHARQVTLADLKQGVDEEVRKL